jgi:hypothetical protein
MKCDLKRRQGLKRERRLNRVEDLFTVSLLSSYITRWRGVRGESLSDGQVPAPGTHPRI